MDEGINHERNRNAWKIKSASGGNVKLSELKVGDEVTILSSGRIVRIVTVDKITPTGFIRVGDHLYTRDGKRRGDGLWDDNRIAVTASAHECAIRKMGISNKLDKVHWQNFPVEKLQRIMGIVEEKES